MIWDIHSSNCMGMMDYNIFELKEIEERRGEKIPLFGYLKNLRRGELGERSPLLFFF